MKYLNVGKIREIIENLPDDAILCISQDGKAYQVMTPYDMNKEK